jgi:hypothetical protein
MIQLAESIQTWGSKESFFKFVQNGSIKIVEFFLDLGFDINAVNRYGETALIIAAKYSYLELVRKLLERGAKVNLGDDHGRTALHEAADRYFYPGSIIGLDLPEKDFKKAILEGDFSTIHSMVMEAISQDPISEKYLEISEEMLEDISYLARFHNRPQIVQTLLDFGANPEIADNEADSQIGRYHGYLTPLILAVANSNLEVIKILLKSGANVDTSDEDETTPLMWAVSYSNYETVKLLLEAGADIEADNADGETALSRAQEQNRTDIVELLEEYLAR